MPLCSRQLQQDRDGPELQLSQSLLYVKDAQATVRLEAVRFIGEPQPPGTLCWQPGPRPHHCTGSRGRGPEAARDPAASRRARHAGGSFAGSLAQPQRPRVPSCPGPALPRGAGCAAEPAGPGPCCQERAREQRPDRSSVHRAWRTVPEEQ